MSDLLNNNSNNNNNNNNNNDPNLQQGKYFLYSQKNIIKEDKDNLILLEQTSSPAYGSIIEGLNHDTNSIQDPRTVSKTNITNLENEFNQILVQYTKNYQLLIDELITHNNDSILLKYAGKNVKYGGSIYYVNNYGYVHEYSTDAWDTRSNSCHVGVLDITPEEFHKLLKGSDMGIGQACTVAGYNVQNQLNGEHSWIDIKGIRHIYPDDVWQHRSSSCQNIPKLLQDTEYKNIPVFKPGIGDNNDSTITETSLCNTLNVDPKIVQNLGDLNDRLLTLGKELLADTIKLADKDTNVKAQLDDFNLNMTNQLNKLQQDRVQLNNATVNVNNVHLESDKYALSLAGAKESSQYALSSNYLQYIIWLVITVLLLIFSFYNYSSDKPSIISFIILIIVALILLYKLGYYIYSKIF